MKTAKSIFTVISVSIIEPEPVDVATCSFVKFGDAVDYIMQELGRDDESIRDALAEEHFYSNEEIKWYVIDLRLASGLVNADGRQRAYATASACFALLRPLSGDF